MDLENQKHPTSPSKPKKALIISVGFLSSLFLSIFVALIIEALESRKHSIRQASNQ
ncbi:hypothetical protein [Sulfurihydrogenibium subterraneum]|uniref:hypothetical protein n=1 Tax=Sulfurihydrogenibium subterraneum TaxID=171121 RepID=UPI000A825B12|nr:hypothetical protein [Sulfurihydrogenibium subterraneum]